jgi:asparagine N-glycosylation enzyme membrane subunit Stt3
MAKFKISPALLIALLIVAFFAISLVFRIHVPYGEIFVGDDIKYASNDAYYYMRLVDNAADNFPQLTQFDPYFIYPGGNNVASLPSFHWLIAVIAWIVGLGNPTQHTVDLIGVYLPAIMGALTIIPVFFIGKTLFNKWVGVFAAGLMAILPGEFLSRSMLGSGDNPVAEVLFTTTALAFLIAAIKNASQNRLIFTHLFQRDWKVILKPLIFSLLAGVFLGFYLTTWQGALIFIFIFLLYLLIQFIINHLNKKQSEYLCIVGFTTLLFALIILLLNPISSDITLAMVVALFVPPVLYGISKFISMRGLKTYFYPITLVAIGVLAVVVIYFGAQDIYQTLLAKFKFVFFPVGATANTTIEMFPFLRPQGADFSTFVAFGNFTTSFFIAPWWLIFGIGAAAICGYLFYINNNSRNGVSLLIFFIISTVIIIILTVQQLPDKYSLAEDQIWFIPGIAFISFSIMFYSFVRGDKSQPWYIAVLWVIALLITLSLLMVFTAYPDIRYVALIPLAILIYVLFRHQEGQEHLRLFIIWSLVILIIMMIQRRFGYYFAVNVALLSGYLAWQVVWLSGIKNLIKKPEEVQENVHISKTMMKRRALAKKRSVTLYIVNVILAIIVVFFLVFCPNLPKGVDIASNLIYTPSDSWQESLLWMRDNTPDPMGDPDAYYQLYDAVPPGEKFQYPDSAYGVTAWWDYGYWIIRIAHRIPNCNPSQSPISNRKVATFFLADNQTARDEIRTELKSDYVIIDYEIATSKFWAILNWAGEDEDKYIPVFFYPQDNQLYPLLCYTAEYYQTLLVRLYNFDGEAVAGGKPLVLVYQDAVDRNGIPYKHIIDYKEFVSYQDALNYVNTQELAGKYEIVSLDPFVSPIPLDALEDYELVYSSTTSSNTTPPDIKIFQYIGDN